MSATKNKRGNKRWFVVAVVLCALAAGGAWVWRGLFAPYRGFAEAELFVEIPRGASCARISDLLAEQGVVRSSIAFRLFCRWSGSEKLQAGEYRFTEALAAVEVFRIIAEGRVYTRTIVVPEGWTIFAIAGLLEREGIAPRGGFLAAARQTADVRDLAPGAPSLEGFLFPATYQFPRRVAPALVTSAMAQRFREVWRSLPRERAGASGLTALQIVTLASLIEREARLSEERRLISSVFHNRLRRGMALQCDPTVIYALELAGKWDGKISSRDLAFDSPYNTYRRPGLPPGPIANPGEASLRAALDPADTRFLYFVSNGEGGHAFSTSLAEHNKNVGRYLRVLARQRRAAAAAANGHSSSPPRAKKP